MTKTVSRYVLLLMTKVVFIILLSFAGSVVVPSVQNTAYACPCGCAPCCWCGCRPLRSSCGNDCACTSTRQTDEGTIPWITDEFIQQKDWWIKTVWEAHMLPSLLLMTEQLTATAMMQTFAIGSFMDAKHQLETQGLFQKLSAQAHKDYHVSEAVCEFGTNTRSLAAASRNAEFSQIALASRSIQRNLLSGDILTNGATSDSMSRLEIFRKVHCNPKDNGNGFERLCKDQAGSPDRRNRDIDFTQSVDREHTLQLDFTPDGNEDHNERGVSDDEEDIFALAANLYGHIPPIKISELSMADLESEGSYKLGGALDYMDLRSLAAKRSVAHNSFAAVAAMRAQGPRSTDGISEVEPYMKAILKNMGLPEEEVESMLGKRPSYYAQMGVLTKKLYQRPQFYTNLYDKPVNVARQFTAMKAIENIQKRDIYRSQLRSEAILATWLETEIAQDMRAAISEAEAGAQEGTLMKRLGAE